jgi:hypothetical protein
MVELKLRIVKLTLSVMRGSVSRCMWNDSNGVGYLSNRHAYCLYSLSSSGLSVIPILVYCPWKAGSHACPVVDAFE